MSVCGPVGGMGAPIVTNYCTAVGNSTGLTGSITAQNIDLNARTMELAGADMPANVLALSLVARQQANVANPGGSTGTLCLGGPIGRAVGGSALVTSASGALLEAVDLDAIPTPAGSAAVMSGELWYFQYWHRDAVLGFATSNFTNGVRVVFP